MRILFICLALATSAIAAPPTQYELAQQAELAFNQGECRQAAETYLQAANASQSAAVAARAADVAVECDQLDTAAVAVTRWLELAPEDRNARRFEALLAMQQFRLQDATRALERAMPEGAAERDEFIDGVVPVASDAAGAYAVLRAFEPALKFDTLGDASLTTMIELAMQANQLKKAAQWNAVLMKRNAAEAQAQQLQSRIDALRGRADEALQAARRAAALDKESFRFAPAETLAILDRKEAAYAEYSSFLDSDAADEASRRLALLAYSSGDFDDAEKRFRDRMQATAGAGEALYYLAVIAERRGDREEALRRYQQLIEAGAGLAVRVRAARLQLAGGERDAAMALLDDVSLASAQQRLPTELTRAQLLTEGGAPDDAITHLQALLQQYPGHSQVRYQLAAAQERAGRIDDAVATFDKLLADRPGDPNLQNALGYTLVDHGRELKRGNRLIAEALGEMPDSPAILDSMGWSLVAQKRPAAALEYFERAYRQLRDSEIAAHWGEALWQLGRKSEARAIWARALVYQPDSQPLRRTIERLTANEKS
ncbi:MAG: tetratricopeptide repeat protein [Steroidobacteraceae bacterium]